jgi:16S rRNA (cytosine967-C5)-methyltransferase
MPRNNNARATAASLLHRVAFDGRSLDVALGNENLPERDRPLIQELVFGSVRHYYSLSAEIASGLITPLKPRDSIVHCLLVVGAYQLRHTRIPPYASVSETVDACRQIARPWARGLINQVLRRLASSQAPAPADDETCWDHPAWLVEMIRADYPEDWQGILHASLSRAPLTLRVDLQRMTRSDYIDLLSGQGVSAHTSGSEATLVLGTPVPAASLPGFRAGTVSVQDEGAQHAAVLLAPAAGDHILDACAAPGGKAIHLLERAPKMDLVALERDHDRCELVRQEYRRRGYDGQPVLQGDATTQQWWDGRPFNRILLDAPCSGTGTLRRHPDIKLLKRATDIPRYRETQGQLLANLWQTLARGGRMLYCTCSVLSAENDVVVGNFLTGTDDATVETILADWGVATRYGRQLLPAIDGPDGFYYSMLVKA